MDIARLPRAAQLARGNARNPRWRPGLSAALYSEIFASSREGSGVGAALALLRALLFLPARLLGGRG